MAGRLLCKQVSLAKVGFIVPPISCEAHTESCMLSTWTDLSVTQKYPPAPTCGSTKKKAIVCERSIPQREILRQLSCRGCLVLKATPQRLRSFHRSFLHFFFATAAAHGSPGLVVSGFLSGTVRYK